MEHKIDRNNFMMQLAAFVVNKRNAFVVLFAIACIYCLTTLSRAKVNTELTDYLPDTTETRQGLDIMEDQFTTFGSAKILVTNITYEKALEEAKALEEIRGISSVKFFDWESAEDTYDGEEVTDYYKDACALYTLTFEEEEDTELSQKAIANVRDHLKGYQTYFYTTVDKDDSAALKQDRKGILAVAAAIIR